MILYREGRGPKKYFFLVYAVLISFIKKGAMIADHSRKNLPALTVFFLYS